MSAASKAHTELPFKLPVRKYVNRDIEQDGCYGIADANEIDIAACEFGDMADAIVQAVNAHSQLVALLDSAVDTFAMSQSGYISGCRQDEKFNKARDAWLSEARLALSRLTTRSNT